MKRDQLGRRRRDDPMEILMRNVSKNAKTGCWNWTGSKFSAGYGYFKSAALRKTAMNAHRASWIIHNGAIDSPRTLVLHKCDNRLCCNPDHLELGTHKTNMADCMARHRISRGNGRPNAKLTPAIVLDMRRMRREGGSWRSIARAFGISHSHASRVVSGESWAHVPGS